MARIDAFKAGTCAVPYRSKRLQGEDALPRGYFDEENCTPSLSCRRKDETGGLGCMIYTHTDTIYAWLTIGATSAGVRSTIIIRMRRPWASYQTHIHMNPGHSTLRQNTDTDTRAHTHTHARAHTCTIPPHIMHHLLVDMSKYERLIEKHVQEWDETTMGKLPQTATYEHTVMRVKTMAPSALSTRYV